MSTFIFTFLYRLEDAHLFLSQSTQGFIVLIGSLELASRQIVAGAVRVGFAIMFSLFFGFGLALGAQIYQRMTHTNIVGIEDYTCVESHRDDLWYRKTPSVYWGVSSFPLRHCCGLVMLYTYVLHMSRIYSLPHGADVLGLSES